jgi:hypothetical protein
MRCVIKRWLPFLLLFLLLLPQFVKAQSNVKIEVDTGDTPLVISGWLDAENAFTGNLRLTSTGDDMPIFTFLPSDLKRMEGDEIIGRQQIRLMGDPTLPANVPKDFQISITGIKIPGTYQGQLEFLLPEQTRTQALIIPLTVIAKTRPTLIPLSGADRVQLRLVNCKSDCFLARRFLPESAFMNTWLLSFDNPNQASVTVTGMEFVIRGEQTGYQLTDLAFSLPSSPQTLSAAQMSNLELILHRENMPPDHYIGAIYMKLDGRDERLTIPVDLSVRLGPFWPILFLFLGIVLGRLVKYMQGRGRPQSEALTAVNRLTMRINTTHPDDRKILKPMVSAVRQLVYREDLEKVNNELATIETGLEILNELRSIETILEGKGQHPKVQEQIVRAKQHLALKQDEEAKAQLSEIKELLVALSSTLMNDQGQLDADIAEAVEQIEITIEDIGNVAMKTELSVSPLKSQKFTWLKQVLAFLSGASDTVRAEATYWLVRPLLYIITLVALLAVGIGSLYIDIRKHIWGQSIC